MSDAIEVYDGVPLPEIRRSTGRRSKFPISTMDVGQMFFLPGRSTRSVSAYISRIAKASGRKFTSRKCWVVFKDSKPVEVEEGTEGATQGTGVWRLE